MAGNKGIPCVSWVTLTDSIVVGCSAVSISTTYSWTGVLALLTDTCLVSWTLSIDNTLWLALYVGVAYVFSNTSTGSCIVSLRAVSIDSTWRGIAGLHHLNWTTG